MRGYCSDCELIWLTGQLTMGHKKQHFVPRCYLKAWHDPSAPPGGRITPYVWQFEKDGENPRPKAPSNLFTETDIYTIERANGERDLRLEHGFSELEDRFTRIRNTRFVRRVWPNEAELEWVRAFVATAQVRTAAMRDHQRRQWMEFRERAEDMERAMREATPEAREAMARVGRLTGGGRGATLTLEDVRALEAKPVQHMVAPVLRTVLPLLRQMHLAVLCTSDPLGFVTTDHPCTWFDPEAYKRPPFYRGPGLASPTIEVTLPITPQQCLVISHHPSLAGYIDIEQHTLDELNRRHIAHCSGHFIACRNETRPAWFVQRTLPDDAWEASRARDTGQSD